ncbi:MAG TPA: hypothetical protein VGG41_04570 [Solirubrobacteraceae bacterium]
MKAIRRSAALAALMGAAALGGLALSPGASAKTTASAAPLLARASFDPSTPAFGDHITATITIEIDLTQARAQTLHVRYDLAPLQAIGAPRTVRVTSGDAELVTIAVPVACITDPCLGAHGVAQVHIGSARASIATAAGVSRVTVAWPPLEVRDRVRMADVNALQSPVEADASPLPPTYRASPATLATIVDIAAVLFGVTAVGLIAWDLLLVRRRRRAPEDSLARALRLARSAQTLPGPDRRRALELLARALRRGELHRETSRLAWSQPTPEPAELEHLVETIERDETV